MKIATIRTEHGEEAGIIVTNGVVTVKTVNKKENREWSSNLFDIINKTELEDMKDWYNDGGKEKLEGFADDVIPFDKVTYGPLYRTPGKIFCIGLNYQAEAGTIGETAATDIPGSFFKSATSVMAPNEDILIPYLPAEINGEAGYCKEVDAEAELVVVMGKEGKDINQENWLDYVAGFTTSIECTAMDVFYRGLRQLSLSKSFDNHFCFGPVLITPDEIDDVMKLKVRTVLNGEIEAEDVVSNMMFTPDYLVSYLSKMMRWMPGDVLSTGTPKGAIVKDGDVAGVEIDGFVSATCPVVNQKV